MGEVLEIIPNIMTNRQGLAGPCGAWSAVAVLHIEIDVAGDVRETSCAIISSFPGH